MRRDRGEAPLDPGRFRSISEAGARNAATALSRMIGRPVRLDVPWARAVPLHQVAELAGGASRVVCALSLRARGEARGNLLLVFGEDQVPVLLALILGRRRDARAAARGRRGRALPVTELERSALREVGNILAAAYLDAVGRLLSVTLLPSIPGLAIDMVGAVTDYLLIEGAPLADAALVLASEVHEPSSGLRVGLFFLPDPEAYSVLGGARGDEGGRRGPA
ncbi:MAG: chemotaxis protein CheC [Acidobacteriota bacterium]